MDELLEMPLAFHTDVFVDRHDFSVDMGADLKPARWRRRAATDYIEREGRPGIRLELEQAMSTDEREGA